MGLTREIWRERWLQSINELTSLALQKKSWLDKQQTNPHWSFVEFMCCYFDDLLCDFPYNHFIDEGWVSSFEYEILRNWHEALDNYQAPNNDDYDHEAILTDKNWLDIAKAGEKSKTKLLGVLKGKEKQIIAGELFHLNPDQ